MSATPTEEKPQSGNDLSPNESLPEQNAQSPTMEPADKKPTAEEMQEYREELDKVEGEIATLRQVLASKVRYAHELKRKMGITPLQEMKQDFQHGVQTIKESTAYQKTSAAAKTAAEKTSTVVSGIGKKLGEIRNSETFKSVEGKVESAYESIKAKVSGTGSEAGNHAAPAEVLEEKQEQ